MNVARAILIERIAEIDSLLMHKVLSQAARAKLVLERAGKLTELRRMDEARKPVAA